MVSFMDLWSDTQIKQWDASGESFEDASSLLQSAGLAAQSGVKRPEKRVDIDDAMLLDVRC